MWRTSLSPTGYPTEKHPDCTENVLTSHGPHLDSPKSQFADPLDPEPGAPRRRRGGVTVGHGPAVFIAVEVAPVAGGTDRCHPAVVIMPAAAVPVMRGHLLFGVLWIARLSGALRLVCEMIVVLVCLSGRGHSRYAPSYDGFSKMIVPRRFMPSTRHVPVVRVSSRMNCLLRARQVAFEDFVWYIRVASPATQQVSVLFRRCHWPPPTRLRDLAHSTTPSRAVNAEGKEPPVSSSRRSFRRHELSICP
jgi:hypothetical protein